MGLGKFISGASKSISKIGGKIEHGVNRIGEKTMDTVNKIGHGAEKALGDAEKFADKNTRIVGNSLASAGGRINQAGKYISYLNPEIGSGISSVGSGIKGVGKGALAGRESIHQIADKGRGLLKPMKDAKYQAMAFE